MLREAVYNTDWASVIKTITISAGWNSTWWVEAAGEK